jgi:rare lipoprotein A
MKRIIVALSAFIIVPVFAFAQTQQLPEGFRQEGIASWYGTEFDGRPTASGEIFNSKLFTAAHPALPFGTIVTVTNTHNGRKVKVRVNDRGPFVAARIIDLSRAAAEQLDMLRTGTAPVVVENAAEPSPGESGQALVLSAASPPAHQAAVPILPPAAPAEKKAPDLPADKIYRLQVGSYKVPRNAVNAFDRLKNAGFDPAYERNGEYFRVVLAAIKGSDVAPLRERLGAAGFNDLLLREE